MAEGKILKAVVPEVFLGGKFGAVRKSSRFITIPLSLDFELTLPGRPTVKGSLKLGSEQICVEETLDVSLSYFTSEKSEEERTLTAADVLTEVASVMLAPKPERAISLGRASSNG